MATPIKDSGDSLMDYLGLVVSAFLFIIIASIIVGVFVNSSTDGTIPVSTAMNTTIADAETNYMKSVDIVYSTIGIIGGIIVLIVMIIIFKYLKGTDLFGGRKGNEGAR